MCHHDGLDDRESKARAAGCAITMRVHAAEAFEQVRLFALRDVGGAVLEGQVDERTGSGGANAHRAGRIRVAERIFQEVRNHLPDASSVDATGQGSGWRLVVKRESGIGKAVTIALGVRAEQFTKIDFLEAVGERACIGEGQVVQIADKACESRDLTIERRQCSPVQGADAVAQSIYFTA